MRNRWILRCAVAVSIVGMLFSLASFGWKQGSPTITTIILVRHAEKDTTQTDQPLTVAGLERAQELARVLADAGVTAIYATQYIRTQQTVQPLADLIGVPIKLFKVESGKLQAHADELNNEIESKQKGGVVVVSSHYNVLPVVIKALGGGTISTIPDSEHDNLFVLTREPDGSTRLLRLKYGKHTP